MATLMADSGDPHPAEVSFVQPALTYWLMATAFRLLGPTLAAGRLVSALAALALIAGTAWVGRLLLDRRAALFGAFALGTTLLVLSFGRVAMSDMLLSLWCTLAVGLAIAGLRTAEPPGGRPSTARMAAAPARVPPGLP